MHWGPWRRFVGRGTGDVTFAIGTGDGIGIHEAGPGAIHSLSERTGVIGNFGAGLDYDGGEG